MENKPVIFLDKDGTLVRDVPYNVNSSLMQLETGAARGLRQLNAAGFRFVVVSNQSGVARGYFPEQALKAVETALRQMLLDAAGVSLSGFYYCPHHPQGSIPGYSVDCGCRKPSPGLLLRAAVDLDINLTNAWMIGDILNDVEAGNRAGCRTVLIENGNETEWRSGRFRQPDFMAVDLAEAARFILTAQFRSARCIKGPAR